MAKYNLVGIDGNAFCIMGYVVDCMRKERRPQWERDNYLAAARSGDYNNLLIVSMEMIDSLNAPYEDDPEYETIEVNKKEYDEVMAMADELRAELFAVKMLKKQLQDQIKEEE